MEAISFLNLATSIYLACWQQLGKVANQMTGKVEKNLEHAKYSIDTLIMLRDKTKGNLNEEEQKTLQEMIANLQLNYVDECNKPQESVEKKEK
jgi:polyhydroxyalkanoate synthesis regulator phasin